MEKEQLKFNINEYVFVRLKDEGIRHYVKKHNDIMPFDMHISFNEYKAKANKEGYHKFQMWCFMDDFGGRGMSLSILIDTNILLEKDALSELQSPS